MTRAPYFVDLSQAVLEKTSKIYLFFEISVRYFFAFWQELSPFVLVTPRPHPTVGGSPYPRPPHAAARAARARGHITRTAKTRRFYILKRNTTLLVLVSQSIFMFLINSFKVAYTAKLIVTRNIPVIRYSLH